MQVQFIASVSIIAPDPPASRALYLDTLGLPLEQLDGDYYASEHIPGSRHFGVWPLSQAAQACYGTPDWPREVPIPQASVEFELANADALAEAAKELEAHGYTLLHPPRTEPWGQIVARILSDEGLIVGLSFAPWLHDKPANSSGAGRTVVA
ncbi:MAG: VOC family protein [Pseudonocardiales bacterium]|nr:VOC family protein [Pseudonocardiales bacterium]